MGLQLTSIAVAGALALAGCGGSGDTTTSTTAGTKYPAAVEKNFTTNCERTSNGNTKGCRCILEELEASFSLAEFTKEDRSVAKGSAPSKRFTDVVGKCR